MAPTPAAVAKQYFAALAARDVDGMVACWQPGGREFIRGQIDTTAPDGVREYFTTVFAAMPDFDLRVLSSTTNKDRAVVRWIATGTFTGGDFAGLAATGSRLELEGIDELTVKDGLITENNAYMDSMAFARQVGMLPAAGSRADARVLGAFNAKTRLARRLGPGAPEPVADGVWIVRGGFPLKTMNVYLVRDGDGVLAFDAGIKAMTKGIAAAAASLGGLTRVVLGHGHQDHRGAAPGLGVPVLCHPADVAITEGDGGFSGFDFQKLNAAGKRVFPVLLEHWDGGPTPVAGTIQEGDDVAGFTVVHLPGHADGLIALYRESDGVALSTDTFYTVDPQTGIKGRPRVPHAAFNRDTEQARASLLKLADIGPRACWPGHADPLVGDVAGQLRQAAATT
ncbi:MAG: beta-lactamase domain protein [Solirubrobacterales bacterium]|nr:beta-lactamase domain protein [Solirubrobacterales bacterium]